ncbi:hypothetical protein LSAT2_028943 [Lamellibrachia satsuma]|nr:hypothetical protein LSAT2_028943 [Lamellibrachia satsuma]
MSRPWSNMSVTRLISVLIPLVALQFQVISTEDCSTRCEWTSWNPWGSCSVTCGGGHRSRDRQLCCDRDHDVNQCLAACGLTSSGFDDSSTCSENCIHGSYSSGHCQCGLSYYGSCCQHSKS